MTSRIPRKTLSILLSGLLLAAPALSVGAKEETAAAQPPAQAAPLVTTRTLSFKQMGAGYPLKMRGDNSLVGVGFGSRGDEVITGLTLHLRYTFSPAMLADLSHVQVLLNDEVVTVLALPKEQGGKPQQLTLPLDPRLLANFNQLKFRLIGHYTNRCEDETHSSLWAEISNASELQMTVQALPFVNDLSYFPEPFFDRRDFSPLKLPFIFAARPSQTSLQAAGELASWFGAQAGWRGVRYSAALNSLPAAQHAIVYAVNGQRPDFLAKLPPVNAPTIAIVPHPERPERKLLLILGRDDKDLKLATDALVLGQAGMSGSQVAVRGIKLEAPRKPYDAPNWVRPDRPTRLGELVDNPRDLQVTGQQPAPVRVSFRVPGDLFTWGSRGIPLDLKFRYTGQQQATGSRLNIGINELFVQSLNLNASGVGSTQTSLRLPVLENGLLSNIDRILLPPFRVGSRNEMQFQYVFAAEKQGECANNLADGNRAAIDPDSTIDFSGYPHYAALPNLGLFATSGFPFTRMADLSDTAVVLPRQPAQQDIGAFLNVMGQMGQSTGYPALRYRLVDEGALDSVKKMDLLIVGNARNLGLLKAWRDKLPTTLDSAGRKVAEGETTDLPAGMGQAPGQAAGGRINGQVDFAAQGKLGAILALESPLASGRSAVIVTGSEPDALALATGALADDGKVAQMSGSAVLVRGDTIDSQQLGPVYYVGNLPLWTWVWLFLSAHPLLLAGLSALAVLIFAFAILRLFKALAARRIRES
ncbi:cellulose biosynthesis cyclic di-GMP-binding regulatory protein BcsB [Chromobacterium subtsugae]|uniref:cellulose biosynthesis cyclic di-GMP-binding regulatory protein BcsB n=1 Tax=Chromobacterium subtsugae TaxID=251747 RepID=UPI00069AD3F7|nr:cellulose biosynthesis cyclic di-GMP-binding regulatory protein BcsB [Chromobacterium subtsugae]